LGSTGHPTLLYIHADNYKMSKLIYSYIHMHLVVSVFTDNIVSGQDDIPICFASGECAGSLLLHSWEVDTISECLSKCEEISDCEYFNYYTTGEEKNSCRALANCAFYSPDICTDCTVGKTICRGETSMYVCYIVCSSLSLYFL